MLKSLLPRPWLALSLTALILVTRTNSSSLIVNPPDATLAVFFIAGLAAPSTAMFALLFGAGALADWFSFRLGVSDWCFTPAYVFLVPTYAALFGGGYFCRRLSLWSVSGFSLAGATLLVSTGIAYLISTYSFFWFSGRLVSERSIVAYEEGIVRYFPNYLSWAVFYAALAFAIAMIVRALRPALWARLAK